MIAVSSLKLGVVTTALKEGTGGASMTPAGSFTGAVDLEYVAEIDAIGTGEIGSSTFKWSDDGGATWDATGVATAHTPISLNNGVTVCWPDHATGADFVIDDKWYFKGINLYNPGKMLDGDRDSRYRSLNKTVTQTITITLAAEQAIDALVIGDHNFASWTLHLWGDDAVTFDSGAGGAPQVDETITFVANKILHYLTAADRTKKYWRLQLTAGTSADAYFEIGELFLGSYMELSGNYRYGEQINTVFIEDVNKTSYGVDRTQYYNMLEEFTLESSRLPDSDIILIKTMLAAITNQSTKQRKPIYFNHDSSLPSDNVLVEITSVTRQKTFLNQNAMSIGMKEVMKSI
jgi:hypothetical protein